MELNEMIKVINSSNEGYYTYNLVSLSETETNLEKQESMVISQMDGAKPIVTINRLGGDAQFIQVEFAFTHQEKSRFNLCNMLLNDYGAKLTECVEKVENGIETYIPSLFCVIMPTTIATENVMTLGNPIFWAKEVDEGKNPYIIKMLYTIDTVEITESDLDVTKAEADAVRELEERENLVKQIEEQYNQGE